MFYSLMLCFLDRDKWPLTRFDAEIMVVFCELLVLFLINFINFNIWRSVNRLCNQLKKIKEKKRLFYLKVKNLFLIFISELLLVIIAY